MSNDKPMFCWGCGFTEGVDKDGMCLVCGVMSEHNPVTAKAVRKALAERVREEILRQNDSAVAHGLRRALNIIERARK